jgi:site-specific recombinase XerC
MRRTDYLFLRPGSRNWHIKLQAPDGRIERSLSTPDRVQAEILALPMIAEHKAKLLEARLRLETTWQHDFEPGREHAGPDGERIIATDRELIHLDGEGRITRRSPNGATAFQLVGRQKLTVHSLAEAFTGVRPRRQERTAHDAIIETYLEHANIIGHSERETRAVWALYKQLTDDKPLKDATRDDGRKVVQHFEHQGLRSATIQKEITWLNAAVNLAIKESKLTFSPFSGIVPKRGDKQVRLPLSEADIKNAKRNLDQLDKSDQLLIRLLAARGMRLSEAFEIDSEMKERGCRYVIVGHKTPQSHRRVPLPAAVLPYLPKAIHVPLFAGGAPAASRRLNKFIRRIGVIDKGKVVHSLRHRAQDRLRAAGCPVDYRWALLGHEMETVAEGYGLGFPVPMLKKWIDKIGF